MKIYPLRHGVSFHLSLSFFSSFIIFLFFLYPLNDARGVDRGIAHSTYYVSRDIISNAPADNIINRGNVLLCTLLHIIRANIQIDFNVFRSILL